MVIGLETLELLKYKNHQSLLVRQTVMSTQNPSKVIEKNPDSVSINKKVLIFFWWKMSVDANVDTVSGKADGLQTENIEQDKNSTNENNHIIADNTDHNEEKEQVSIFESNAETPVLNSNINESNHTTEEIDAILRNEETIHEMAQKMNNMEQQHGFIHDTIIDDNEDTFLDQKTASLESKICQALVITLLVTIIAFTCIVIVQKWEHEKMNRRS